MVDVTMKELIGELKGHTQPVSTVSFCRTKPDTLATCSSDTMLKIWNLSDLGEAVYSKRDRKDSQLYDLSWNQDDTLLGICGAHGRLRVVDPRDNSDCYQWNTDGDPITAVRWLSPMILVTSRGDLKFWDLRKIEPGKNTPVMTWDNVAHTVSKGSNIIDSRGVDNMVASAGLQKGLQLWQMATTGNNLALRKGRPITRMKAQVTSLSYDRTGDYLAVCSAEHGTQIFDSISAQNVAESSFSDTVNAIHFGADGYLLESVSSGNAEVMRLSQFKKEVGLNMVQSIPNNKFSEERHEDKIVSVSMNSDCTYLASASRDKTTRIWSPVILQTMRADAERQAG